MPFLFAHHMAVELLGREFSPHGVFEHVCAFSMIGFVLATSVYGSYVLFRKVSEGVHVQSRPQV